MSDAPSGMQAKVERLLQVLAVLRAAELPVSRTALVAKVDDYRRDHEVIPAAAGDQHDKAVEALAKKVNLDLKHLKGLGFAITDTAAEGSESTWVLRATPWRLPVELDDREQTALAWVLGTSAALEVEEGTAGLPPLPASDLLGSLPSALDLAHAALAGRRRLVIERRGEQKVVEPVQMSVRSGRWYLLVRYGPGGAVYGYRLDRLRVVRLAEVMPTAPEPVDERVVLDPTAWRVHPALDVDLRCDRHDAAAVGSWFPRAEVRQHATEVSLGFSSTNLDAVVDRVIGLAGAARLVAPAQAVDALRARLLDALAVPA